jgi:hypothetical protein
MLAMQAVTLEVTELRDINADYAIFKLNAFLGNDEQENHARLGSFDADLLAQLHRVRQALTGDSIHDERISPSEVQVSQKHPKKQGKTRVGNKTTDKERGDRGKYKQKTKHNSTANK